MQRLFADKLCQDVVPVDGQRLLRMDEYELDANTQREVKTIMAHMDSNNFKQVGDYQGYKNEFLQLNGFGLDGVNYDEPVDIEALKKLQP